LSPIINLTFVSNKCSPDFEEIKGQLKTPVIFDGRNQYIAYDLENKGLEYFRIGK
jgi:UDPglucose 6-dehydrogenase